MAPQELGTLKAHVRLEAAEETDGTTAEELEVQQDLLPVERCSQRPWRGGCKTQED